MGSTAQRGEPREGGSAVSPFFFDRRRSEHFAELMDDPDRLRRHRRLSRAETEIDRDIQVGRRLQIMPLDGDATEEFRRGLRELLMAAAQREDDGLVAAAARRTVPTQAPANAAAITSAAMPSAPITSAAASAPISGPASPSTFPSTLPSTSAPMSGPMPDAPAIGALARPARVVRPARSHRNPTGLRSQTPGTGRTRAAVLVGVTAGALALSGVSAASTDSLPGDALYQVKRSSERAQLALAASDQTRGQLYLEFAHSRVLEAHQVGTGLLADVLADMDVETVAGVNLLTTAAVARHDANILTAISNFVAQQRDRLDELHRSLLATSTESATSSLGTTGSTVTAGSAGTAGSLSVAGAEPIRRSTMLLNSIDQRTRALTHALLSGCPSATIDTLGPKPTSC